MNTGASANALYRKWFAGLYFCVLLMVLLGGTTRLTGSGLSIVDWRPVTGAVPPLSEGDWQSEFAKYQGSPEFRAKNFRMDLDGFRRIYLWEYTHRLVGRILGLLLLAPALYLWARRRGETWIRRRTLGLVLLVAAQGLMGWLMVASGLVDRPEVSHFRLAAHLLLAVTTLLCVAWTWLELRHGRVSLRRAGRVPLALGGLLFLQLTYGAFLAGLKAGWAFSTFPTFNGEWVPLPLLLGEKPLVSNFFYNGFCVHWIHRVLGVLAFLASWRAVFLRQDRESRRAAAWLAGLVTAQFALGAVTVVMSVPIPLAVAHQFLAMLLISAWLRWAFFRSRAAVSS